MRARHPLPNSAVVAMLVVWVGCAGGAPSASKAPSNDVLVTAPVEPATAPAGSAAVSRRSDDAAALFSGGDADVGPRTCGCALCEPVVSEDACKADTDCAPSVPCHAPACVAKGKAEPRKPDTMCTQMLDCASADVNRCTCLRGKCALAPPIH
jgi:hypothetical protein